MDSNSLINPIVAPNKKLAIKNDQFNSTKATRAKNQSTSPDAQRKNTK